MRDDPTESLDDYVYLLTERLTTLEELVETLSHELEELREDVKKAQVKHGD